MRLNLDPTSELLAWFNHPKGHVGLPRAYFKIRGMDLAWDDGLIYESVLREEGDVGNENGYLQGTAAFVVEFLSGVGG